MKKTLTFKHSNKYEEDLLYYLKYFTNHMRYLRYTLVSDVEVSYAYSEEPVPFEDIPTLTFKPIKIGEVWSEKNFACAWFRVQCKLPAAWRSWAGADLPQPRDRYSRCHFSTFLALPYCEDWEYP